MVHNALMAGIGPLPATELAVMDDPDKCLSAIASSVSMQLSNVGAALPALSSGGQVEKRPDPRDRRSRGGRICRGGKGIGRIGVYI